MSRHRRKDDDRAAAQLTINLVSYAFGVPSERIESDTRGTAQAALARQTAMYLLHVGFAVSLARVAEAFGRDRSTVAHACRLVEERRDDPAIDALLCALEAALREAPPPRALAMMQAAGS